MINIIKNNKRFIKDYGSKNKLSKSNGSKNKLSKSNGSKNKLSKSNGSLAYRGELLNYKLLGLIFMVLLIILQIKFVEANFVCGKVLDSDDNMSAQWYHVRIYYPENPLKYGDCEISPSENKYCCDTESIPGKGWKIGDVVVGEVVDFELGYKAGSVSVVTSGEGYTLFPEMKLEKVIKANIPKLIFSNLSNFILNASFAEPYNFVELEKQGNKIILCENCNYIEQEIQGDFGMNNMELLASYENKTFVENINVAILQGYNFDRETICDKCKNNKVKKGQEVEMRLNVNLSHDVESLELKEYVPVEWEILETDGEIKEYSDSHNLIVWNVSGKDIVKDYKVRAPNVRFLPKKYIFKTELEDKVLKEDEIIVHGFLPFFSSIFSSMQKQTFSNFTFTKYSKVSKGKPLIKKFENRIVRLAIFSKQTQKGVSADLLEENAEIEGMDILDSYLIKTNFDENIEKIYIEFKLEKELIGNYEEISLFSLKNGWEKTDIEVYDEDSKYVYYKGFLNGKGIAITGRKKGFFEKIKGFFG